MLAQYATPAEILANPADEFVADFVGADRALKRLGLTTLADVELTTIERPQARAARSPVTTNVRDALSAVLAAGGAPLTVVDEHGEVAGAGDARVDRPRLRERRRERDAGQRAGIRGEREPADRRPVGPSSRASDSIRLCERANRLFCWGWFKQNWGSTLWPALRQHVVLVADRGRDRLCDLDGAGTARLPLPARRAAGDRVHLVPLHDPGAGAVRAAGAGARAGPESHDGGGRARRLHAADPVPQHPHRAAQRARARCATPPGAWA